MKRYEVYVEQTGTTITKPIPHNFAVDICERMNRIARRGRTCAVRQSISVTRTRAAVVHVGPRSS